MLLSVGYRGASALLAPLVRILLSRRLSRGKEDAARLGERTGRASRPRPDGRLVWIHGASVGEAMSALPLIDRLLAGDPALHVLMTTGTVTSAALMAERLPARAIHQFVPVDCAPWVERFLDHWRPDVGLWLESELWPNLLLRTAARGVPLALVNARMSARSDRRWRRWPWIVRPMLRAFRTILAQSDADAARYRGLLDARTGSTTIAAPGNLKLAGPPLPVDAQGLAAFRSEAAGRPLWLAASTHPGEEAHVAAVHQALEARLPGLLTVIVPRHPARGAGIADDLRRGGIAVARRSAAEPVTAATGIYVADTLGELGLFYRVADIVFLGGSLVPHGGHNPAEPARLDCALLWGPHMESFATLAAAFVAEGAALTVADAEMLGNTLLRLFENPALAEEMATAARALAGRDADVLDGIVAHLRPLLPGADTRHANTGPEKRHARA